MQTDTTTQPLERAYRDALDVQSACNLSGVLESLHRHLPAIREDCKAQGGGTDTFNRHPVCRLFAEQIAYLTGMNVCGDVSSYSAACREADRRFGLTL